MPVGKIVSRFQWNMQAPDTTDYRGTHYSVPLREIPGCSLEPDRSNNTVRFQLYQWLHVGGKY